MFDNSGTVPFPVFIVLWNRMQNMGTPDIHFRMAHWLEESGKENRNRRLLMAFRSSGKSTIVGLYCAWRLLRDPDLRILVLAADGILARKMVRNVKRIIEKHPLTRHLVPGKVDQWANDRFTVNRGRELRDPSMLAKGITSNITGCRADIIICDDVEVPNTCDSAEKREDLRQKLFETDYVRVPGGLQLYVGTPHTYYTIYAVERKQAEAFLSDDNDDETPFLAGYDLLKIPLLDLNGRPAWPEKFDMHEIRRIRTGTGPNKFASQMMLTPVNIAEGRLDPENLKIYDHELSYSESLMKPVLKLGDKKLVSASAWWDPSFGGARSDSSVAAAVYTDEDGNYRAHEILYIPSSKEHSSDEDEATRQCRLVARFAAALHLPSIALEINGIGRFLPGVLRRVLAEEGVACAVLEKSSRRPKDLRIIEAFDTVLAARALYIHKRVLQTPFLREMQEWRPGSSNAADDGLDALAGALSLEPLRFGAMPPRPGGRVWTGIDGHHIAKTDFDV